MNAWPLVWSHGQGWVEAMGGMLGPVNFRLPDGKKVQPFAVFPWADEPLPADQQPLTGLMSRGRGEWPCVPFGINSDASKSNWQHPIHGASAHGLWRRIDNALNPAEIRLRYSCPASGPIENLERHVIGVDGDTTIACRLIVHVRRPCKLPIGLHPTLRLPVRQGALKLNPGQFRFARSYPSEVEPGADIVAADQEFADLAAVPRRNGGSLDLGSYPLGEHTESLIQLCGIDGQVTATNVDEGYSFVLSWDQRQLPSCLLWISNAGRRAWPWSRRHYALGIEPVCAAFDLGVMASTEPNSISARGVTTAIFIHPDAPLVIDYRLGVCAANQSIA